MRLRRMGAKHQPSYRIVVADSRSPRDGRYIDQVGFYNPLTNPADIKINQEKAIDWLRRGAQPTETVTILLNKHGIRPEEVRKGRGPEAAGPSAGGGPVAPAGPVAGATVQPPGAVEVPAPSVIAEVADVAAAQESTDASEETPKPRRTRRKKDESPAGE